MLRKKPADKMQNLEAIPLTQVDYALPSRAAQRPMLATRCIDVYSQPILLAVVCCVIFSADARSADLFYEQAIRTIQTSHFAPQKTYGFVVNDEYSLFTNEVLKRFNPYRDRYEFYFDANDAYFSHESYRSIDGLNSKDADVIVFQGDSVQMASTNSSGKHSKAINFPRHPLDVGEVEQYRFLPSANDRLKMPGRLPYQMLANPCLATLDLPLEKILQLPMKRKSDVDGLRVYEARQALERNSDAVEFWRLYFDDAKQLVRSVYGVGKLNGSDRLVASVEETRTIAEWQTLAGGERVPAKFVMTRKTNGRENLRLSRIITNVLIGSVPRNIFDTNKLDAFSADWVSIRDGALTAREIHEKGRQSINTASDFNFRIFLVSINVAIVFALAIVVWWRWSSRASGTTA